MLSSANVCVANDDGVRLSEERGLWVVGVLWKSPSNLAFKAVVRPKYKYLPNALIPTK